MIECHYSLGRIGQAAFSIELERLPCLFSSQTKRAPLQVLSLTPPSKATPTKIQDHADHRPRHARHAHRSSPIIDLATLIDHRRSSPRSTSPRSSIADHRRAHRLPIIAAIDLATLIDHRPRHAVTHSDRSRHRPRHAPVARFERESERFHFPDIPLSVFLSPIFRVNIGFDD
nr:hypothetical protein CFP56_43295 [Quercus suber]